MNCETEQNSMPLPQFDCTWICRRSVRKSKSWEDSCYGRERQWPLTFVKLHARGRQLNLFPTWKPVFGRLTRATFGFNFCVTIAAYRARSLQNGLGRQMS